MKPIRPLLLSAALLPLLSGCTLPTLNSDESGTESSAAPAETVQNLPEAWIEPEPATAVPAADKDPDLALYLAMLEAMRTYRTYFSYPAAANAQQINSTYEKILRDHPEIFWITGTEYTMYPDKTEFKYSLMPGSKDDIRSMSEKMQETAHSILVTVPDDWSDYEKALYIHDYLADTVQYDFEGMRVNQQKNETKESNSAASYNTPYGGLIEHSVVCAGYAATYQYLMQSLGIECGTVSGTGNGDLHAWNYVLLDGKYYWVDVTWDDPSSETEQPDNHGAPFSHFYCFVNDELISRTHTPDEDEKNLPVCDTMDLNYYVQNGSFFDAFSEDAVLKLLRSKADQTYVEMMFADQASYQAAVTFFKTPGCLDPLNDLFGNTYTFYHSDNDDVYAISVTLPPTV